jgi:hypothetical protein
MALKGQELQLEIGKAFEGAADIKAQVVSENATGEYSAKYNQAAIGATTEAEVKSPSVDTSGPAPV